MLVLSCAYNVNMHPWFSSAINSRAYTTLTVIHVKFKGGAEAPYAGRMAVIHHAIKCVCVNKSTELQAC